MTRTESGALAPRSRRTGLLLALAALATGLPAQPAVAQSTATPCTLSFRSALFVPAQGTLTGVVIDDRCERVYLTNSTANSVETFEIAQARRGAPIPVGALPSGLDLSPDGGTLYVANRGGVSLSVVDVAQQVERARIQVPRSSSVDTPFSLAVAASGLVLFSTTFNGSGFGGRLLALDPVTQVVTPRSDFHINGRTTERTLLRASADRSVIGAIAGNLAAGPVFRYASASDAWGRAQELETFVASIALSADGSISLVSPGTFVLDSALNQVGLIPGGGRGGVAVDPSGRIGYQVGPARIDVLDLVHATRSASLAIGDSVERANGFAASVGQLALSRDGSLLAVITDHGFALVPTGAEQTQPFAALSVGAELDVSGLAPDLLQASVEFTVAHASNGIRLDAEPLVLQLGAATLRLPAGALVEQDGRFVFDGPLDGADVRLAVERLADNRYELLVQAEGLELEGTTLPARASLKIGDDTGATTLSESRLQTFTAD